MDKKTKTFGLFFLLFILLLQSCSVEREQFQASVDANKQSQTGSSSLTPVKMDVGANIGFSIIAGLGNAITDQDDENTPGKTPSDDMKSFQFSGGLEFIQKRSKEDPSTLTFNYIEIPLYALYKYDLSKGNIFGGLGPYFAYGIGGNIKTTYMGQTTKFGIFDKNSGFKRFDAGIGLTAGYTMTNSFSLGLGYDLGLANINSGNFGDKSKNRCISFDIAYPINEIIKKTKNK